MVFSIYEGLRLGEFQGVANPSRAACKGGFGLGFREGCGVQEQIEGLSFKSCSV